MAPGRQRWTQATTKTLYGSTLKYAFHLPFEHTSHWLSFAFQQLTGQANGLSSIYERIAYTIRELQDDKAALQNRIEELEQGDPSVEVRRLREENSTLRARLATAAKEKSEITWECDALLRKLNAIKLLVDGPAAVRSFPSFHTLI
jgi:predicted RNase H-like nuclease (RuvC/YqgF family)